MSVWVTLVQWNFSFLASRFFFPIESKITMNSIQPHLSIRPLNASLRPGFSAIVGNWIRTPGNGSDPEEINMPSTMKGDPDLATGLSPLGGTITFHKCWWSGHQDFYQARAENLSPAMGQGINSRNRVLNWVVKLHRLAGQYDNPMPTWFLAPVAGLKLPTQDQTRFLLLYRGSTPWTKEL